MDFKNDDSLTRRMAMLKQRAQAMRDHDFYFYNQPIQELRGGAGVFVNGPDMSMYASYSYLGLIGHPRINEAAKRAVDKFGTGTHGVRTLAGSLTLHRELEETMAAERAAEARAALALTERLEQMYELGAKSEVQALQWIMEAEEFDDFDLRYGPSYFCYHFGLNYSAANDFRIQEAMNEMLAEVV